MYVCRGVKCGGQLRRRRYQGQAGHSVPLAGSSRAHVPMLGLTVSAVCSSRDEAVCTLYYAWICSTTQPLLGDPNVTVNHDAATIMIIQ